jgi:hypothetical protein
VYSSIRASEGVDDRRFDIASWRMDVPPLISEVSLQRVKRSPAFEPAFLRIDADRSSGTVWLEMTGGTIICGSAIDDI